VGARPGQFVGVELVGGTHIDAEGSLADLVTQLMVGFPSAANVAAVQTLAATWINDMYSGTPITGGQAGQLMTIPTPYGNATAVVLPTPSTPFTPLIGALRDFTVLVQSLLWGSVLLGAQPSVV
jgi:hypothetical protein